MRHAFLALGIVFAGSLGLAQERPPSPLSPEEQKAAAGVAEESLTARSLKTEGPLVFVSATLFRDKAGEDAAGAPRLALVTHYRYDGDLTISTVVDLARRAVVSQETAAHVATALAEQEVERAKSLALADARVKEALGVDAGAVRVEALLLRVASPEDPLYGKRTVTLLFRAGRTYVRMPGLVHVDLTSGKVVIEAEKERREGHEPHD